MSDRTDRIAELLAAIHRGEQTADAMRERYGLSCKDAGRVVVAARARARMGRSPQPERAVARGVWMRPDIASLFDALAETEGGKGIALSTALYLLRDVRAALEAGPVVVTACGPRGAVLGTPATATAPQPRPATRARMRRPRLSAGARRARRLEQAGQAVLWERACAGAETLTVVHGGVA